jgi:drug/metabolite transporter (DMT)-like permease
MVLAMVSFTVNDTCVKIIGKSLPVGEIMGLRGFLSVLLIASIAARQGVLADLPLFVNRNVLLRTLFDFLATLLFITALLHMQIANLTAINQTVPLAVTTLSALVLGERIGRARIAAIVSGFLAVLMIVRPNPATLSVYDGLGFAVVFAVAVRDLATRKIPATIPNLVVALSNATLITIGGWLTAALEGFVVPALWQVALLSLAAVFLACGYMLIVATLRLGDLSASAPFRYSVMVFALISGIVVFHEYPDRWAIAGMLLIVATGLIMARREAGLQK